MDQMRRGEIKDHHHQRHFKLLYTSFNDRRTESIPWTTASRLHRISVHSRCLLVALGRKRRRLFGTTLELSEVFQPGSEVIPGPELWHPENRVVTSLFLLVPSLWRFRSHRATPPGSATSMLWMKRAALIRRPPERGNRL